MVFKNKPTPKPLAQDRGRSRDTFSTKVPGGRPIDIPAHYSEFRTYYPECELQTKKWLSEHVGPDWVCIDAGANIGYHSILMARHAQSGRIYAFEPTSTHDFLLTNLEANSASNVTALRVALTDRSFIGEDAIYRIWGEDPELTSVQFLRLDDFVLNSGLQRLDLVKVDVDGYDLEVLWGAEASLRRFRPVVIVELNHALLTRGYSPAQAIAWLVTQGYRRAVVLDTDNWVFYPDAEGSDLRVSVDVTDPKLLLQEEPRGNPKNLDLFAALLHNGSCLDVNGVLEVSGPRWSYGMTLEIPYSSRCVQGLHLSGLVESGDLGAFLSNIDGSAVLGYEFHLDDSNGEFNVYLPMVDSNSALLVLRKTTGRVLRVRIKEICAYTELP